MQPIKHSLPSLSINMLRTWHYISLQLGIMKDFPTSYYKAREDTSLHTHTHIYLYVHTSLYIHPLSYTHSCTCTHISVPAHTSLCTHIYTYFHIHICISLQLHNHILGYAVPCNAHTSLHVHKHILAHTHLGTLLCVSTHNSCTRGCYTLIFCLQREWSPVPLPLPSVTAWPGAQVEKSWRTQILIPFSSFPHHLHSSPLPVETSFLVRTYDLWWGLGSLIWGLCLGCSKVTEVSKRWQLSWWEPKGWFSPHLVALHQSKMSALGSSGFFWDVSPLGTCNPSR